MNKSQLMYFKYKQEIIYLENIHNPQNETQREFEKLIEELNIEHSFQFVVDPKYKTKCSSFILVYKDKEFKFSQLLENFQSFNDKLDLPNNVNGLELKQPNASAFKYSENKDDYLVYIETCRMFQNLYMTFASARYSLLCAYQKLHTSNEILWSSTASGQFFIRSIHLNNAIVGYSNSFDILLQCIWLGYKLFCNVENNEFNKKVYSKNQLAKFDMNKIEKVKLEISKAQIEKFSVRDLLVGKLEKILKRCSLSDIEATEKFKYIIKFNNKFQTIRDYANSIKHRGGIKYEESYVINPVKVIYSNGLNSHETINLKDIDAVINELVDYHIEFIKLTNTVFNNLVQDRGF